MHQDIARTIGLVALLSASLVSQGRTLRVPGDFARLDQAVTAAADGDTILMSNPTEVFGQYSIQGKALSIISPNGTTLSLASIRIESLPAGKQVSLYGFRVPTVVALRCQGSVLLENCELSINSPLGGVAALTATDSRQVYVKNCKLTGSPAIFATRSALLVSDSQLAGNPGQFVGHYFVPAGAGVQSVDSNFVVSRTTILGGSAQINISILRPREAVHSSGSHWTVTGLTGTRFVAGTKVGSDVSAVIGSGSMTAHPNIQFVSTGSAPAVSGVTLTRANVPSLKTDLGTAVTVDLAGAPSDLFGLTVSVPGQRLPLGTLGDAWHSTTILATAAAGSIPASGRFQATYPRVVTPSLVGRRLVWQAIGGSVAGGFLLSNPDTFLIH